MKLANFSIAKDFIAVEIDGVYYDLHNNFDFIGLSYDLLNRRMELSWVKSKGTWVSEDSSDSLSLKFLGVSLFKCKERDSDVPYSEDDCLSAMGFIHNDMIDEIEGFAHIEPKPDACHLNISFMSGFAIKIASEIAECTTN